MPEFAVDSDATNTTSGSLQNDFNELQNKLADVRNKIGQLLENGYRTPAAQQKFQPFFEEFGRGFEQVNTGLEGISAYVRGVGQTFEEADNQLGSNLGR